MSDPGPGDDLPPWRSVLAVVAHPDGALTEVDVDDLSTHVLELAGEVGADRLLPIDTDGVTGHRDHARATLAALTAACHPSQAVPESLLWRRLDLLGDHEYLRWLRRPHPHTNPTHSQPPERT